jgi:hypothetical protein
VVILTYPMMGILLIMMVGFLIEVRSDKREWRLVRRCNTPTTPWPSLLPLAAL